MDDDEFELTECVSLFSLLSHATLFPLKGRIRCSPSPRQNATTVIGQVIRRKGERTSDLIKIPTEDHWFSRAGTRLLPVQYIMSLKPWLRYMPQQKECYIAWIRSTCSSDQEFKFTAVHSIPREQHMQDVSRRTCVTKLGTIHTLCT